MLAARCAWIAVVLVLVVSALEYTSTEELYDELVRAERFTLVYVYSVGCVWCQRLNPHFGKVQELFGGQVAFARIDGRKCRVLSREFNIESYPQLLLFGPGPGTPQQLLRGVYRGERDFRAIAHYLGEVTGQAPRWPAARDNVDELAGSGSRERLQSRLNARWRHALGLPPTAERGGNPVLVLLFVSPWMCLRHQGLLLEQSPSCVIDQLSSLFGPDVEFWRIDYLQSEWSELLHEFRVSTVPTVVVLPQQRDDDGGLVALELLQHDREVWQHELELLSRLLAAAVGQDQRALAEMSQEFHSVQRYGSLREMQLRFENERDETIEDGDDEVAVRQLISRLSSM